LPGAGTGLAALFKKTFSIHDPVVATIRGSSIDQLSFGAILAQAQQGSGTLSEAGSDVIDVIDGIATDAVALVPADPAADAGPAARDHRSRCHGSHTLSVSSAEAAPRYGGRGAWGSSKRR
jgi:hypothetical protein